MFGAVIGDIVGSRFEFNNIKTKDFEFFHESSRFTDDTVLTVAVAWALLTAKEDPLSISEITVTCLRTLGKKYFDRGYGRLFKKWLLSEKPEPYLSYGNGAAMRVSPCGMVAASLEEARILAREVTRVTHNHPLGIKGAEALASAIFLARIGARKEDIAFFISENYYNLNFPLDSIRDTLTFDLSCEGTMPQAFRAFLESSSFEEAIRNAISLGGDSDTLAAITGSLAAVYHGIPVWMEEKALTYLDSPLAKIISDFEKSFPLYFLKA
ncbi:MAG: ADP-ribosylglycohydrolase family protein [Deltaproteobacteria bacterium]|jgi:type I restriction enzyme M protein|nr:ADP-ribosylglycohydrolase family protein [Deltaproteobacteria bacterium]